MYFFALAAEKAWGEHRRPALEAAFLRHAPVRFPYGKKGHLELGADYVEVNWGRTRERLAFGQIASIDLMPGLLVIKPRGKGWFSHLRLRTALMGDLQLLLGLLQRTSLLQF